MSGSVRSIREVRPTQAALRVDLWLVLLAVSMLGLALYLPSRPLPFTRIYQDLHPRESSTIGSYVWSEPAFSLLLPIEQVADQALVRQQMTAGATPDAARPLRVSSGATSLEFMLHGGTPLRTYAYLLPLRLDRLDVQFSIAPIAATQTSDQRALGLVLMDTQVDLLGSWGLAGPAVLALIGLPLSLLLAGLGWGVGPWRRPLLLLISLVMLLFYRHDRYDLLPFTLAMHGGLLLVAGMGLLCRRLLQIAAADDWLPNALLWCMGAVITPWTYLAAGFGLHLGRQWLSQPLLCSILLSLPLVALLLYLWLPAARRFRPLLLALALSGVLGWGGMQLSLALSQFATDYPAYYDGAQRVLQGRPLYELERLRSEPFSVTYKYHPFFLAFVMPLALVPLDTSIMLWRGLGLLLLVASLAMIIMNQPVPLRWRLVVPALLLGTNLAPVGQTLRLGQTDILLLFGLVAALASFRRYPWLSAGIWSALGLAKIYPLVLLLPALLQRAWRRLLMVGAMLLAGVAGSLIFGWANQLTFWTQVVPLLGDRNGRLANQSIYGLVVRSLNPDMIRDTGALVAMPAANLPFLILSALILVPTLWLLLRLRTQLWEAVSLLICTLLLVMPVSWDHYQTLLILPLLLGAAHILREPRRHTLWLVAAYALLAFGTIKNLWLGINPPTSFGLLFASYRTLGLLLLWGWWLRYALDVDQAVAHYRDGLQA